MITDIYIFDTAAVDPDRRYPFLGNIAGKTQSRAQLQHTQCHHLNSSRQSSKGYPFWTLQFSEGLTHTVRASLHLNMKLVDKDRSTEADVCPVRSGYRLNRGQNRITFILCSLSKIQ